MDFLDANEFAQMQMRVIEAVMLIIAVVNTIFFIISLVSIVWLCFREAKPQCRKPPPRMAPQASHSIRSGGPWFFTAVKAKSG
jgi:hypothetical protein